MRLNTTRSRGFTLLEAMLAVAILGFGLALLVRSVSSSLGAAARAREVSRALELAKAKMAELEGLGLLTERELEKWEEDGWLQGDFAPHDPDFTYTARREPVRLDPSVFEAEEGGAVPAFDEEAVYLEVVTVAVGKVGEDGVERELVRMTTYVRPHPAVAASQDEETVRRAVGEE